MRKLKLFMAACALLGASQTWAQTDVTDTYITNADFEGTYSVLVNPQSDRAIYQPNGWTVTRTGSDTNDMTILKSTDLANNSFSAFTINDASTRGDQTYWTRLRWSNNTGLKLSQTVNLPKGYYTLTALVLQYNNNKSNNKTEIFAGSNKATAANSATKSDGAGWNTLTVNFTLDEASEMEIGFQITHATESSGEQIVGVDNFILTYTDPEAGQKAAALAAAKYTLNGYIKKATALNTVLADETFATAITTAQGVYDAADSYDDDYENTTAASTTLSAAITTALSGSTQKTLTNGNFDTSVNIAADGTNSGTMSSTATEQKPYIWTVSGWTDDFTFSSTASQGTTAVYGASCSGSNGTNGTNSPATDMFGATEGGTLHLSSGWGDQARYTQALENLPSGRYIFYYEANNQNSGATTINSNYFGVSGTAGDFYGTTNSFVYSDVKTFAYDTWTANAFEFDVAKTADITFNVGVIGTTSGSANGAKLWIDNVLVYRIGDIMISEEDANTIISSAETAAAKTFNATEKTALNDALTAFEANKNLDYYNALTTALVAANTSIEVYETLDAAITKVEGWTSDATTVTDPIRAKYAAGSYSDETTAANIYSEYQAAEIAAIVAAEGSDYTSVILNHSFETGDMTGWSAASRTDTGVKENSNATYAITSGDAVNGSYIFNSWGGTAENNVYQTIPSLPAGTYQLSALMAGFVGEELVIAAGETTNSVTVTADKKVGYTVSVVFTLAEAGDVVIKASNTKGAETASDASFIKVDNFTLNAYSDPLAALKEQLTTKKTQATTALNADDYVNVTGSERTTLQGLVDAADPDETEDAYTTAISDITTALTAFTEAKSNYDAFATAVSDAAAYTTVAWPYASEASATALATAVAETPSTSAEAATNAAAIVTAYRLFVESNGKAEGAGATVDYTSSVAGNDASVSTSGWTYGIGTIGTNSGEGYTNGSGTLATKYFDGGWSASAGVNISMTQDVTLPAGDYLLQITARGATNLTAYSISVGETSVDLPKDGNTGGTFGNGWSDKYLTFTSDGTAKTITITATSVDAYQWISFNRIRLTRYGSAATMEITDAQYATFCAPFAVTIPEDVTAYTVDGVSGTTLTMNEVKTTIPANTPVVLYKESALEATNFYGKAVAGTPTEGLLTGVYAETNATPGTYVLQKNNDKVGFYKVEEGSEPTIGANRCYLKAPASARGTIAFFLDTKSTGIDAISALTDGDAQIFNTSGVKLPALQKGMNIVKRANGKSYKVMVK